MLRVNVIPIVAAITPYKLHRRVVEDIIGENNFVLIYVKCSISVCEERDIKGLYKLARKGKIKKFTGISDGFEEEDKQVIVIDTDIQTVDQSVPTFFKLMTINSPSFMAINSQY